jgi:hypothetical protein
MNWIDGVERQAADAARAAQSDKMAQLDAALEALKTGAAP